jgi:uncharacterized protein (DUF302 family)
MKLLIKGMLCASLVVSSLVAKEAIKIETEKVEVAQVASSDIEIITSQNSDGNITPKLIEEAFKKAGFTVSANRDMNGPFVKQFKSSGFDTYNLFTFYKLDAVLELVKKYPNVGLFAPMSMSIYTKKGEKSISVSSLTATAMAKIMKAPADDKTLLALRSLVKETLQKAMPQGTFTTPSYTQQEPRGELVTTFTMEMDPEEWEDELDELKMGLEGELAPNGFVIAGFNNLGDEFEESKYEAFDFYEVYSICKLPVIYTIAKSRPEAGAFAPCSLYLSKKKEEKMMHIAFPSVYNWMSSMAIENKEDIEVLETAQAGMKKILSGLTE